MPKLLAIVYLVSFFLNSINSVYLQLYYTYFQEEIYCNTGEYLTSQNKCAICPSGCLVCQDITGICDYCSGIIPAWTNPGATTAGCNCPTSQFLAFNTNSQQFQCMQSAQANQFYNETIISAMTTNLTDANIIYLKGAAFGVNGNGATAKLLKIINILEKAQNIITASAINLIEISYTLIGIIKNQNSNTYEILHQLVYFANELQTAKFITEDFTQYFTEFHGLLISKLNSQIDFTGATTLQQQALRRQIQTTFDNFKAIFMKYHDFTQYNEYIYHYTNLYIRTMKVTDYIYSKLYLGNYKFEGQEKLLKHFPANQSIYFIHVIEQINPFANVSSAQLFPPYSYVQDIQFFIGANYTNAMSYLGDVTYEAGLYYPYTNKEEKNLLSWDHNSYSWKYQIANCGVRTEGNYSEIYCYPDSLAKSTLYGIESNSAIF